MPDYRTFFDRTYLGHFDLPDKDVIVTISRVVGVTLNAGSSGVKTKKPAIFFEGREKALAANKTNCKTIAGLYGTDTDTWVGKRVQLFVGQTAFGGETMPCIRVRPQVPVDKAAKRAAQPAARSIADENATPPDDLGPGRQAGDE